MAPWIPASVLNNSALRIGAQGCHDYPAPVRQVLGNAQGPPAAGRGNPTADGYRSGPSSLSPALPSALRRRRHPAQQFRIEYTGDQLTA